MEDNKIVSGTDVTLNFNLFNNIEEPINNLAEYEVIFKLTSFGEDNALITKTNCTINNNVLVVKFVPDDTKNLFGSYEFQVTLIDKVSGEINKSNRYMLIIEQNII